MKATRVQELFESYFHYWIMKLKLYKKYRFTLRKDLRLICHAWIDLMQKNCYEVRYNPSKLKSEYKIIETVLHEVGHLFLDWRTTDKILHEAEAEYFALSTMKKFYPKFYKRALNWTKRMILDKNVDEIHVQGYIKALGKLGKY
jgi:hypothetical protein